MKIELWLEEAVEAICQSAASASIFPRDVEAIANEASLSVFFVPLPNLTVERVETWIAKRHGKFQFLCSNRPLRGCIVALRGRAVIFTDTTDSADEQRFTQAHELGHFLADYQWPRQRALDALGEVIRPVLDGDRPPTRTERVHAALADVPLGYFHDLMARDEGGQINMASVRNTEARADCLALNLLAPVEIVCSHIRISPTETERNAFGHEAVRVLCDEFGLPRWAAREYGRWLWTHLHRPSSRQWLGL
jgi:hypothetical protein